MTVTGQNFSHGVWTVGFASDNGSSPIIYVVPTVLSDQELTFVTPARMAGRVHPFFVGPGGTGAYQPANFEFV